MKPLLIVLNSNNPSRIHHLQKLSSLKATFQILLIIDSKTKIAPQQEFIDDVIQVDMSRLPDECERVFAEVQKRGHPKSVLNLSEFMVPLHALLVEKFKVWGPNSKIAEIGREKYRMREFCQNLAIPVPRYAKVTAKTLNTAKTFSFPVIVKPEMGGGSQLVQRFESWSELERGFPKLVEAATRIFRDEAVASRAINKLGELPFMVEELIGGTVEYETELPYKVGEISVESIYFADEVHVLAIHDKPLRSNGPFFEEFVWSTPSRISNLLQEKARDYVTRIHRALGPGAIVLHTEFRTIQDNLVILEFGVRMGGAAIYRSVLHSTGIDMIDALIAISSGERPAIKPVRVVPTITHALWANEPGTVQTIHGEELIQNCEGYVEHIVFDLPGSKVFRAPMSTRANGHLVFQSSKGFPSVEQQLNSALNQLWIQVVGQEQKPNEINRI
jgi:biotin carboxylase